MKQLAVVCLVFLALPLAHIVSTAPTNDPPDAARSLSALKMRLRPTLSVDRHAVATVCAGAEASLCRTEPTALY